MYTGAPYSSFGEIFGDIYIFTVDREGQRLDTLSV